MVVYYFLNYFYGGIAAMQPNKIVCKCIERRRDNNGNTTELVLQDNTGNRKVMTSNKIGLSNKPNNFNNFKTKPTDITNLTSNTVN